MFSPILLAGASLLSTTLAVSTYSAAQLVPFSPKNTTSVDQGAVYNGVYYLADRVNQVVHVIDIASGRETAAVGGWAGLVTTNGKANTSVSGPNGLVVLPDRNELWGGDGDGSIRVVSLVSNNMVANISTKSKFRADEMAYDPTRGIVVCTSPNDKPPFVSVVNATSRTLMGNITFNNASGLEQPAFDPATGTFYVSVPSTGTNPGGEIAALDITNMSIARVVPLSEIIPAGIVFGLNSQLFVAASQDQILTYNQSRSVVLDVTTGTVIANISGVAGVDQVAYDPTANLYFASAYQNLSPAKAFGSRTPILAVVDAVTNTLIQTIVTDNVTAHSVAVDPSSNKILVPLFKKGIQIYTLGASSSNATNGTVIVTNGTMTTTSSIPAATASQTGSSSGSASGSASSPSAAAAVAVAGHFASGAAWIVAGLVAVAVELHLVTL